MFISVYCPLDTSSYTINNTFPRTLAQLPKFMSTIFNQFYMKYLHTYTIKWVLNEP